MFNLNSPREMLVFFLGAAVLLVFKYAFILIREGWGGDKTFAQKQEAQSGKLMLVGLLLSWGMQWLNEHYTGKDTLGSLFVFAVIFSIDYCLRGRDMKWWQILLMETTSVLISPLPRIGMIGPLAIFWLARRNQFPAQQEEQDQKPSDQKEHSHNEH